LEIITKYKFQKFEYIEDIDEFGFGKNLIHYFKFGRKIEYDNKELIKLDKGKPLHEFIVYMSRSNSLSLYGDKPFTGERKQKKIELKQDLVNTRDSAIIRYKYGTNTKDIPKVVVDIVERAQEHKHHPGDWDVMAPKLLRSRESGYRYLTIESIVREIFNIRMGDSDFDAYENQMRIYYGKIDLTGVDTVGTSYKIVDDTLYIFDYKPIYKFDSENQIERDFLEISPQLMGYTLSIQEETNLKVKYVPFNDEGAEICDPFKLFLEIEAFTFGYTDINNKIMDKKLDWQPRHELKSYFINYIEKLPLEILKQFILNNIDKEEFEYIVDKYKSSEELEQVRIYYDSYYEGYEFFKRSLNELDKWRPMEMIVLIELFFDLHFHITN